MFNYLPATLLLGPAFLAVVCAYRWWRRLSHTKLLVSIDVIWAAVAVGALWVLHDARGAKMDTVVGDSWTLVLIFAPPFLSAVSIYFWWPRIARPVHYFFITVICLWVLGLAIFFSVLAIGLMAVPDDVLNMRLWAALLAFLAITVAFLVLARHVLRRPDRPGNPFREG
jgi:hypothetical protein